MINIGQQHAGSPSKNAYSLQRNKGLGSVVSVPGQTYYRSKNDQNHKGKETSDEEDDGLPAVQLASITNSHVVIVRDRAW